MRRKRRSAKRTHRRSWRYAAPIVIAFSTAIVALLLLVGSPAGATPGYSQKAKNAFELQLPRQTIRKKEQAYRLAVRANDAGEAAFVAQQLGQLLCRSGNTHFKAGDYGLGTSAARTGLRWLARAKPDVDTLHFQLLSLTAACYGRIPLADSATYWYNQASAYLAGHPRLRQQVPDDVCVNYMSHANFLSRTGDSRRAFDHLQVAAELAQTTGNRRLLAIINNYLGNYFFQMRQFDQANTYYRSALRGYEAGSVDQCWGYVILGNNDRAAGRPAVGLVNLQKGQQLYKKRLVRQPQNQDADFDIQSNYYVAECRRALDQPTAAAKAYRTCLALHQQQYGGRGEFMAYSWIGLGHIAQRQADFNRALALARQGSRASCYRLGAQDSPTDYAGTVVNEKTLYEALKLEADLWQDEWLARRNRTALTNAVQRYDQALTIAARLRRNLMPTESKFFLSNKVAPCVERAMTGCYELFRQTGQERDKNRLFALMERHRAMTTADLLHEKYRIATAVPAPVGLREQSLRRQKLDLEKAVADAPADRQRASLRHRLNAVTVAVYQFLDSLEGAYPRYYALKYDVGTLSIRHVQQQLPNGAGYLTYFVGDRYMTGFLISQTESHVFRVPLPQNVAGKVDQLWRAVQRDPGMFSYTGQRPAAALYAWLIRPIERQLRPLHRLIIARDGLLHYVPFDLLQPTDSTADYLSQHVAISYGYSAELTFSSSGQSTTSQPRVVGFAPYCTNEPTNAPDPTRSLSWSRAEVRAWGGRVLAGKQATKELFLRVAPQSDVVVLATHAQADEEQSEHSFVAFHPSQADNRLRATEIINLSLDRLKLVVLSACEGNAGALQRDEGLLSLARAFRLAGCRTILTTSWPASDESTAALNGLFRQHVANGLPTDLALQQARADFRTDKQFRRWNHPYYWANFTLIGAPTTLYSEPSLSASTKWMGILSVLVLALTGWWLSQRLRLAKPRQAL